MLNQHNVVLLPQNDGFKNIFYGLLTRNRENDTLAIDMVHPAGLE